MTPSSADEKFSTAFFIELTSSLPSRFTRISLSALALKCELTWNRSIEFIHAHSEWEAGNKETKKKSSLRRSQIEVNFLFLVYIFSSCSLSLSLYFFSPFTRAIFIQYKKSPPQKVCVSFSCECKLNCVWFCFSPKRTQWPERVSGSRDHFSTFIRSIQPEFINQEAAFLVSNAFTGRSLNNFFFLASLVTSEVSSHMHNSIVHLDHLHRDVSTVFVVAFFCSLSCSSSSSSSFHVTLLLFSPSPVW